MKDTVIYTAIFGPYDRLIDPVTYSDEIDYICFTDNLDFSSDVWHIRILEPSVPGDMIRSARFRKICPHNILGDYKYSLYVDGNMRLNQVPNVEAMLGGKTIAIERHRKRNCIYVEAGICKERQLDYPEIIDRQMAIYKQMEYPSDAGLYATYMIARKHNDKKLIILNEVWWSYVGIYSRRDQLSFPVVFQGYPMEIISARKRSQLATIKRHRDRKRN